MYSEWKTDLTILAAVGSAVALAAIAWSGVAAPVDTDTEPASVIRVDSFDSHMAMCNGAFDWTMDDWSECVDDALTTWCDYAASTESFTDRAKGTECVVTMGTVNA